jgi:hypothetical protein
MILSLLIRFSLWLEQYLDVRTKNYYSRDWMEIEIADLQMQIESHHHELQSCYKEMEHLESVINDLKHEAHRDDKFWRDTVDLKNDMIRERDERIERLMKLNHTLTDMEEKFNVN